MDDIISSTTISDAFHVIGTQVFGLLFVAETGMLTEDEEDLLDNLLTCLYNHDPDWACSLDLEDDLDEEDC